MRFSEIFDLSLICAAQCVASGGGNVDQIYEVKGKMTLKPNCHVYEI